MKLHPQEVQLVHPDGYFTSEYYELNANLPGEDAHERMASYDALSWQEHRQRWAIPNKE